MSTCGGGGERERGCAAEVGTGPPTKRNRKPQQQQTSNQETRENTKQKREQPEAQGAK